jgi:hypothetical protein
LIQVVFSTGTIYLLLALHATSNRRVAQGSLKSALSQVDFCIHCMSEIGISWRIGNRTGDILRSLLEERLKPILARRFSCEPLLFSELPPDWFGSHPSPRDSEPDGTSLPPHNVPAPSAGQGAEAEWSHPVSYAVDHDAGLSQVPYDFTSQTQVGAGFFDAYAEAGSPSGLAFHAAHGKLFSDLDMSHFLLPTLGTFGPTEVYKEGAWSGDFSA